MQKKNCHCCNKEFYPYLGSRVYCSKECYLNQKSIDNIANWKIKREKRIEKGKSCRRCKKQFTAQFNSSRYCNTCRDILAYKPKPKIKKEVIVKKNKRCIDCNIEMPGAVHNKLYCSDCKEVRRIENGKRSTAKASQLAKDLKKGIAERGGTRKIDPKWLQPRGSKRKRT